MKYTLPERDPEIAAMDEALRAPFGRNDVSFRKGSDRKSRSTTERSSATFYPYFEIDLILDRLREATGNRYSLEVGELEWKQLHVFASGHLEIPGLGRRAAIGTAQHTFAATEAWGTPGTPGYQPAKPERPVEANLVKKLPQDLLRKAALGFGVGDAVRKMDPIDWDPYNSQNHRRTVEYMNRHAHLFADKNAAPERTVPSQPGNLPAPAREVEEETGAASTQGHGPGSNTQGFGPLAPSAPDWGNGGTGPNGRVANVVASGKSDRSDVSDSSDKAVAGVAPGRLGSLPNNGVAGMNGRGAAGRPLAHVSDDLLDPFDPDPRVVAEIAFRSTREDSGRTFKVGRAA